MSKHTPGPWNCYSGWTIRAANGKRPVAQAYCDYCADTLPEGTHKDMCIESEVGDKEALANAALIAAAPDLLEALDGMVQCIDAVHDTSQPIPSYLSAWYGAARAAIAKAEG